MAKIDVGNSQQSAAPRFAHLRARGLQERVRTLMLTPPLQAPWKLYPLYGLQITDDDGLASPLFGDATLVAHSSVVQLISQSSSPAHAKAWADPLVRSLHNDSMPPLQYLLEVNPDCLIAVKREKEAEGEDRAREIQAMLSATLFLRAQRRLAFASRPAPLVWGADHGYLGADTKGQHKFSRVVVFNDCLVRRPLIVSKQELRDSWDTGKEMGPGITHRWDIHKQHSVCRLLGDRRKSSDWLKRLRAIGVRINDSWAASAPQHQLQMAVSTIESLMCVREFSQVEDRAQTFSLGWQAGSAKQEGYQIGDVLKVRHKFVHHGEVPKNLHEYARAALMYAWIYFDIAVSFAMRYPQQAKWESFLMAKMHLAKMCKEIEAFDPTAGPALRLRLDRELEPLFHSQMTLRAVQEAQASDANS